MKIHDAIVFCSRYGAYIVMQMGLANHIEELVIDYLLALEATTLKWYKVSSTVTANTTDSPDLTENGRGGDAEEAPRSHGQVGD
jgi:hypothetical protein